MRGVIFVLICILGVLLAGPIGLVVGSIIGILFLIFSSGSSAKESPAIVASRICPFCAEQIKSDAVVCKHCGKDVPKEPIKVTVNSAFKDKPDDQLNALDLMRKYGVEFKNGKYHWNGRIFDSYSDPIKIAQESVSNNP